MLWSKFDSIPMSKQENVFPASKNNVNFLNAISGGQVGAVRYSVIFAVAGTAFDFATMRLKPMVKTFSDSVFVRDENGQSLLKLPEWSPIQVLDEEALAAKKAREEKLYAQRVLGKMSKEES